MADCAVTGAAAPLGELCRWAAGLELAQMPPAIVARLARVIADTVACAAAAARDAELPSWLGPPPVRPDGNASLLGHPAGTRLSDREAARRNAIQANWLQLDEGQDRLMCHAGLYVVPPALAACEARGHTLGELLRAVGIGYEVCGRLASSWAFAGVVPHPHALWSGPAAAVTLAALRRQSGEQLLAALQHAATLALVQPFGHVAAGAMASNLWVGQGVAAAFDVVEWTSARLPAPAQALAQLLSAVPGATEQPHALVEKLGERWSVERNYHKQLACGGQAQPAIRALLEARQSLPPGAAGRPEARVQAFVHSFALRMAEREPCTSLGARFSIPHLLAVAWLHGRTDPAALGPEFLADPAVAAFRRTVQLSEYAPAQPAPHHQAARVTVSLPGGTLAGATCLAALGSSARPLDAQQLADKCRDLSQGRHAGLLEVLLALGQGGRAHTHESLDRTVASFFCAATE